MDEFFSARRHAIDIYLAASPPGPLRVGVSELGGRLIHGQTFEAELHATEGDVIDSCVFLKCGITAPDAKIIVRNCVVLSNGRMF